MAYLNRQHCSPDKGEFSGAVCFNKPLGPRIYQFGLRFCGAGAEVFAGAVPGQFAQLDLAEVAPPPAESIPPDLRDVSQRRILLRRPFSFSDVTAKTAETLVEVIYCVVGTASLRMTTLSAGDSVSVIGPLGNGFWVPKGKKTALLVAGGMGAGPLQHLAKVLTADYPDINIVAFAGAKTATELPFEAQLDAISQQLGFSLAEFAKYGVESVVATDDGSAGWRGFVTDCFAEWLGRTRPAWEDTIIYSCGPEAMLARMAQIACENRIDCQVSMERMMACGFGVCQSCAVECRADGSNETVYKLCCKDGPVFDSREVVFSL